jgi:hypothetical protein
MRHGPVFSQDEIVVANEIGAEEQTRRPLFILCGLTTFLAIALLVYSQTMAFAWDEGFHLLAAQLIKSGKRPYLDFVFSQTPLNAYWNAGWMSILGETWQVTHAVAALMTAGAVLLAAGFVLRRFPRRDWRLACAVTVVVLTGLSIQVVYFGTIAQAYGLCLFLIVAAFRVAVASVERNSIFLAASAGFLASAAAGCSLLTAPVAPVLLLWIFVYSRAGTRIVRAAAFVIAAIVPFLPVLWLFVQGPRQVFFNVIQYNLLYRQVRWEGAPAHNVDVLTSWFDSSQAIMLGLLAIAGVWFIAKRSYWDRRLRAQFYLCGWLSLAFAVHISTAVPTFARYYLFLTPFLAILAAIGLYAIATRLYRPDRPWRPVLIVCLLFALGLVRAVYEATDDFAWRDFDKLARMVTDVTPRENTLLADEHIYFLTRHPPPSGMELEDSHKFDSLPPATAALLHIVQERELDRRIRSGEFSTLEICGDNAHIRTLDLPGLYKQRKDQDDCSVFWDLKQPAAKTAP